MPTSRPLSGAFWSSFEALSGTPNDRRAATAALATAELRKAYFDGDNAVATTVSKIAQGIEDVREDRMTRNGAAEFIAWLRGPVISTLDKAVTAHKAAAASTLHKLRVYQAVDIGLLSVGACAGGDLCLRAARQAFS